MKFFSSLFKREKDVPVLKELPDWQEKMKNPNYLSVHIAEATPRGKLRFYDEIKRRL